MNFVDCFNILQNRKAETENKCCDIAHISTIDTENSHNNNNNPTNNNEININQFIDIKTIQLINIFQKLQEERVKTYQEFDRSFNLMIEEGSISQYSILCGEITARFKAISSTIIGIQITLSTRSNISNIHEEIIKLQNYEKEKLVLIAAQHLDTIRVRYPMLATHIGLPSQPQDNSYTLNKIRQCEENINNILENIQGLKCDLIESDNDQDNNDNNNNSDNKS